jgi:hypothetical protein
MPEPTNTQLATQIATLLQQWNAREAEMSAWMAGAPDGGANSDGRFPLTDASGNSYLTPSLLKLVDMVSGPAALAGAAQLLSEAARDVALSAQTAAAINSAASATARLAAVAAQNLAEMYSLNAAADAANAQVFRDQAEGFKDIAENAAVAFTSSANIDGGSASNVGGSIPFIIDFGGAS